MRATQFVWRAAGSPPPVETNGTLIRPRATSTSGGPCAHCGAEAALFALEQAISDKFTTVRNAPILWPHGGDQLCAGCTWAFKSLLVRSGLMFARLPDEHGPGGIWPVPTRPFPRPLGWPKAAPWFGRPDALAALLAPPPVPFVAWMPLYGIDHGGEMHIHRTFGPDGAGGIYRPPDPLWKLQTKHCLPFASIATDRRHYQLAVDDWQITVDVDLWTRLRSLCEGLLVELRAGGIGAEDARNALRTLEAPRGAPLALASPRVWRGRVAPLQPHCGARWFEIFIGLLRMPDLAAKGSS